DRATQGCRMTRSAVLDPQEEGCDTILSPLSLLRTKRWPMPAQGTHAALAIPMTPKQYDYWLALPAEAYGSVMERWLSPKVPSWQGVRLLPAPRTSPTQHSGGCLARAVPALRNRSQRQRSRARARRPARSGRCAPRLAQDAPPDSSCGR